MAIEGFQEFTLEFQASQLECFKSIMDFEAYPSWSSTVKHAKVINRHADGFGKTVEFRIDLPFKSVRYVLDYTHKKPGELQWKSISGDIESVAGSYTFKKLKNGNTEVTCRQAIKIGFWVPAPLRAFFERTALRDSVLEFQQLVERNT